MRRIYRRRSLVLVILFIFVGLTLTSVSMAQRSSVLDQGTLVVQQGPIQLGQGSFTLVQLDSSFIQLVDHMRLAIPQGPTVTFTATLQMDGQFNPSYYVLNALEPQGQKTIIVQVEGDTARMLTVESDGASVSTSFTSASGFVLFDNNLFGQTALVYQRALAVLNQGATSFQSTALIPQIEGARPMQIDRGEPVEINADGTVSMADRLLVTLETAGGPQQLELLGQGDRFIGMALPHEEIPTVFRSDLFPTGFTIQR